MQASEILDIFLEVSTKSSQIATVIRKEKALLDLLTEEKSKIEKNNQFFQDFKTLADVLIQETARHIISQKIPDLGNSIYGEESNTFTNANNESITVEVCQTQEETKNLLKKVLGGCDGGACILADVIHSASSTKHVSYENITAKIDTSDCGVWIDPIDATGQYIKGTIGEEDENGLTDTGLQCVVILIGMFQKSTGTPVLGVVDQPFSKWNSETESWTGRSLWGLCLDNVQATNVESSPSSNTGLPRVIMSKSESESVAQTISSKYKVVYASGAGYKLLATAMGLVDAYVLSHCSIYRWDCCAVHAILLALGGGIVSYKHARELAETKLDDGLCVEDLDQLQISYVKAAGAIASRRCSVSGQAESLPGIIAYRSAEDAIAILKLLRSV